MLSGADVYVRIAPCEKDVMTKEGYQRTGRKVLSSYIYCTDVVKVTKGQVMKTVETQTDSSLPTLPHDNVSMTSRLYDVTVFNYSYGVNLLSTIIDIFNSGALLVICQEINGLI